MSEILMGCIMQSLGEAIKEKEFSCPVCMEESTVKDWDWSGERYYGKDTYSESLEYCLANKIDIDEYVFTCPMCGCEVQPREVIVISDNE